MVSNFNSFQNHKIMPTLFGDYLGSGDDIYLIYKKENTQKCGWRLSATVEGSWWVLFLIFLG